MKVSQYLTILLQSFSTHGLLLALQSQASVCAPSDLSESPVNNNLAMSRPQALVYRGPAACEGCPEAVAHLLKSSPRNFEVHFAGPEEEIRVTLENLQKVDLYAQPGGEDGIRSLNLSTIVEY